MKPIEPTSIETDAGTLDLSPATIDDLRGVARYWPMGLLGNVSESIAFGLVFQHGDQYIRCIKMQPIDIPERDAVTAHHVSRALIASALPTYLAKGHKGVMLPCAYYKKKSTGLVETGIAMFVGPDADSRSRSGDYGDIMYDNRLGAGATPMIMDMMAAISAGGKTAGLPLFAVIGIDLRPQNAVGGLKLQLLIEGPRVFVVADPLQPGEPAWEYVVRSGFSRLLYAPMQSVGFAGEPPSNFPRA